MDGSRRSSFAVRAVRCIMDFFGAMEALEAKIHHHDHHHDHPCPLDTLGVALEDPGHFFPVHAALWNATAEPDHPPQGAPAEPGDPQRADVEEDPDLRELDFILEHLGEAVDPQRGGGESDPHKEASVRNILEQLKAESAHLLPVHAPSPPTPPADPPLPPAPSPIPSEQKAGNSNSSVKFSDFVQENLVPVALVGGELLYAFPAEAFAPALAPADMDRKRPAVLEPQDDPREPYIKKPPNAFMIFRQEQRLNVVEDLQIRDSAVVNVELGRRWSRMSEEEKQRYFQEGDRLRHLHEQLHPNWSSSDNYGKKRKRIRRICSSPTPD